MAWDEVKGSQARRCWLLALSVPTTLPPSSLSHLMRPIRFYGASNTAVIVFVSLSLSTFTQHRPGATQDDDQDGRSMHSGPA